MPARLRLAVALVVAAAAAIGGSFLIDWKLALTIAMGVFGLVYSVWFWIVTWRLSGEETQRHAGPEEPGRRASGVVAIVLALAALGTVGLLLLSGGKQANRDAAIAVIGCVIAWFSVHTVFTGLYADYYYDPPNSSHPVDDGAPDGAAGGVEFEGTDVPCYKDFAYLAFTLGMTFQVSDTDLKGTRMRTLALQHSLLSYLFGTVIIATLVNFVAGLG